MVAYHRQFEQEKAKYQPSGEMDRATQGALATQKKTTGIGYSTAPSEVHANPGKTHAASTAVSSKPPVAAAAVPAAVKVGVKGFCGKFIFLSSTPFTLAHLTEA